MNSRIFPSSLGYVLGYPDKFPMSAYSHAGTYPPDPAEVQGTLSPLLQKATGAPSLVPLRTAACISTLKRLSLWSAAVFTEDKRAYVAPNGYHQDVSIDAADTQLFCVEFIKQPSTQGFGY